MPKEVKTDKDRARWLMPYLRRLSRMWPPANEALNKAKVAPGRFRCAQCDGVFTRREVHRDHIEPVVPIIGLESCAQLIETMLCFAEGYQILCIPCHEAKSIEENKKRREWKKSKQP